MRETPPAVIADILTDSETYAERCYTLEEFCGRFDYTKEKALYEIRRLGIHTDRALPWPVKHGGTGGDSKTLIHESEVDRYQAALDAEKQAQAAPVKELKETHSAFTARRLNEGADRETIALELYHRGASDYNMGRALKEERPGDEKDTVTKRGFRFRESRGLTSKKKH